MSGGPGTECLQLKEEDVSKFLLSGTHLGTQNLDFQMESYIYKRKPDGVYIINLRKTWEKLLMAARILVAIENPADICVVSARQYCQRSILKFAQHTGSKVIAGRFTPGIFTNQIQSSFKEPRILVINDPVFDHQAVIEASYVNIPVIAFCNTDAPLKLVDLAIPCNNRGVHSTGLMWWMLAREVLRMRGTISRETPWDVMVDLYFYRDPEEAEKEEATAAGGGDEPYAAIQAPAQTEWGAQTTTTDAPTEGDWSAEPVPAVENWGDSAAAPAAAPATSAAGFGDPTAEWARPAEDNWQAQNKQATGGTTDDWGAATTGEGEW